MAVETSATVATTTADHQHPRVHVDSAGDVRFVRTQLVRAAEQLADELFMSHLAETQKDNTTEQDTELRVALRTRATRFVDDILSLAAPGIVVNGLPYADAMASEQHVEPLDDALKLRVAALANRRDDLLVNVVSLRKEVPASIAQVVSNDLRVRSLRSVQVKFPDQDNNATGENNTTTTTNNNDDVVADDADAAVDYNLLLSTYEDVLETPATLSKTIPILKNKLERAKAIRSEQ